MTDVAATPCIGPGCNRSFRNARGRFLDAPSGWVIIFGLRVYVFCSDECERRWFHASRTADFEIDP